MSRRSIRVFPDLLRVFRRLILMFRSNIRAFRKGNSDVPEMHCIENKTWDKSESSKCIDTILDCAFKIHRSLGPGLLESVYHNVLFHELLKAGLVVESEVVIPVNYDGILFEFGFRTYFSNAVAYEKYIAPSAHGCVFAFRENIF